MGVGPSGPLQNPISGQGYPIWTPSGTPSEPCSGPPHGVMQRVCRKAPVALLYTGGRGRRDAPMANSCPHGLHPLYLGTSSRALPPGYHPQIGRSEDQSGVYPHEVTPLRPSLGPPHPGDGLWMLPLASMALMHAVERRGSGHGIATAWMARGLWRPSDTPSSGRSHRVSRECSSHGPLAIYPLDHHPLGVIRRRGKGQYPHTVW